MKNREIKRIFNRMVAITGVRAELLSFKHEMYKLMEDEWNDVWGACLQRKSMPPYIFINKKLMRKSFTENRCNDMFEYSIGMIYKTNDFMIRPTTLKGFYELVILHELTHAQNIKDDICDYKSETKEHLAPFYNLYNKYLLKLIFK